MNLHVILYFPYIVNIDWTKYFPLYTYKQVVTHISRQEPIDLFGIGLDERNVPHSGGWNAKRNARSR